MNLHSLVTKDYLAAQIAEQRAYLDIRFAELDGKFRVLYAMTSIIMAAVILPYLERLLAL